MRLIRILIRLPFVVVLNALALSRWSISAAFRWLISLLPGPDKYVRISLKEGLPLGRDRSGLAAYFDRTTTFLQLRRDLKRVTKDKRVKGIVVDTHGWSLGRARSQDLVELLDIARSSGLRVVSTFDMAMTSEYLLAASADDVTMTPAGRLYTFGSRIEQFYFTPLLRRLGIVAQFVHIGTFKTGYNRFVRDQPGDGDAAMTSGLRRDIDALTVRRISERRGVPEEVVQELFRRAPVDARWARRKGLIDAQVFRRDLATRIEVGDQLLHKAQGREEVPDIIDLPTWVDDQPKPLELRSLAGDEKSIAVIDLSGMIIMPGTNIPGANQTIDPDDVLPVLKSIEDSPRWDGLLVHINSPGGSALASDIIWHALDEVRAKIPVVAYCTEVAGSGGYYLACGADQIVCRPESIIGSIGVITGKISGKGALDQLGVERFVYQDDEAPPKLMSLTESFDDDDLELVKVEAREFYRRFLHRVGIARGLPKRRLHRYARGRVYLGEAAFARGLVDRLDGFEGALECLEELIEAEPGKASLNYVGIGRQSLADAIRAQLVPSLETAAETYVGKGPVSEIQRPVALARLLERETTLALADLAEI